MTGTFATRLFRITFAVAGIYNLAFGVWSVLWPLHFFLFFHIAPPRYPQIWSCVGMVVGLYGLLYWYVAWKPERGKPIIAVGLLGKVLGPIGMAMTLADDWPRRLGMLNLYNDVLWWFPFSLFLIRGTRLATWIVPSAAPACAGLHTLGVAMMALVLRHGMLTEPDVSARASFIAEKPGTWALGWIVWMLSAISLVAFYAWWGSQLSAKGCATAAVLIAALGAVFDLSGESISVLYVFESAAPIRPNTINLNAPDFVRQERLATYLTAGIANLLYTVAGILLMLTTPNLPKKIRLAMSVTWLAGFVMSVAAFGNHVGGLVAATVVLFPTMIGWVWWMGRHWRRN